MNWQFGYGLGRSEFDGQLLGAASAAADCFKALVPFFLFAAIRNRMWSQALALLDANPGWLGEDPEVIAQIHPREYVELELKNLVEFEQRKYGSTLLVFYEKKET